MDWFGVVIGRSISWGRRIPLARPRSKALFSVMAVLAGTLPLLWLAVLWYQGGLLARNRAEMASELVPYVYTLESDMNKRFALLEALGALLALETSAEPTLDPQFQAFLGELGSRAEGVRSFSVSPGGVRLHAYPGPGSESVPGRNLLRDERPEVQADIRRAIQSRRITLSSPRSLGRSDHTWIAWLAIYRGESLWGLVDMEMDLEPVLSKIAAGEHTPEMDLALRDSTGRVLYGQGAVFDADPVLGRIQLADGYWELAGVPAEHWSARIRESLLLFLGGGLAFALLLAGLVFLMAGRQALLLAEAQGKAALEERQRLARELHDSVTQLLYSLTLQAESGRRLATGGDLARTQEYLGRMGETAQQALKEMRLLLYELRPSALEQEGLVGALQQRLESVEKRSGVKARLLVEGTVDHCAPVEQGLYLIAQEALNNALKHAAATSVVVKIKAVGPKVEMDVVDDGRGFDPDVMGDRGGLGLGNMRERAEGLGSRLMIRSEPGAGTTVRVSVDAIRGTRERWSGGAGSRDLAEVA